MTTYGSASDDKDDIMITELARYIIWMKRRSYSQTCHVRSTKSPNLKVSRFVLQLSLPNSLKSGIKSGMMM